MIETVHDELPTGAEKAHVVEEMFDRIAPRYDLLNRLLTFRMDVGWRRAAVNSLELVAGARVLDLACGTGDLCRTLDGAGYRPIGVDFSAGMLAAARTPAPLVRADAARLPFADGALDGLTCGFALRNFVDLSEVLTECARVLRPRGRVALVDVSEPGNAPARAVHGLWFRHVVPFVGGLLSDRRAYSYLPASTAYLPPREQLLQIVGAAGFVDVSHRTLGAGAAQLITGDARMTRADVHLATTGTRLVARTEALAPTERLLDHLGPDGGAWLHGDQEFVTAGVAAIVQPSDAVAALRAIERHRTSAPHEAAGPVGPRAFGALPFSGGGRMIVPARIVERAADGQVWRTVIEPAPASPPPRVAASEQGPTAYTITRITDEHGWEANVSAVLALIDAGAAEKVVLAREVVIDCTTAFDLPAIVETLRTTQPGCFVYADDGFVGASPELLVRRNGRAVTARPMAGTAMGAEELVRSEKDAREHQLVVDAVLGALAHTCDDASARAATAVPLADLTHLATTITARVRDLDTSAVDLALALHPTPAVAGTPRATALATIARLEPTPRDLYAGPCGWVNANGDGEFVVALRGAQIDGTRARLHAGAGIVAGSRADAEWAETQAKLEPMLRALIRP